MTPDPGADDPSSPSPSPSLPFSPPHTIGNPAILQATAPKLALFSSVRCPGALILAAYDLARNLRDAGVIVISGFHTPVERDILTLLLRGAQPIVICPARTIIPYRIPPAWKSPVAAGRLLITSPFGPEHARPTAPLAAARNRFAATLAPQTLILHATPNGAAHHLAQHLLAAGTPVLTLDHPANTHLLQSGALPLTPGSLPTLTARAPIP